MIPVLSTAAALTPLLLLACPVGMGLMMFLMMRGGGHKQERRTTNSHDASTVADLKAEQARLAEQIEQLEHSQTPDSAPAKR